MSGFSLPQCALGVATAATQIEGGNADTNWHRWAAEPGRIKDGTTPVRAADHWNRVAPDTALLAELGIRHYRMGLEWARLEPRPGEFDDAAFAHYRDELHGLRAAGVTPLVTLHHFNNPWWFEQADGFGAPDAREVFLRYVDRVVTELGDLVDEWITINEPNVYGINGYYRGEWPPGETSRARYLQVVSVMAAAHIDAYRLIHRLQPHAKVGCALHLRVFAPLEPRNLLHRAQAYAIQLLFQDALIDATTRGVFRFPLRPPQARSATLGTDGITRGRYVDFHGVNYYSRSTVSSLADGVAPGVSVNDLGWEIHPEGLIEVCRRLYRRAAVPIYVTENGTADAADAFRARYLYEHLAAIAGSDLPITRYYHWCLTDNWEWAEGESARFGLVAVDYPTQQRTVRESGRFYADVIRHQGVTPQAYERWVAGQEYPTNAEDSGLTEPEAAPRQGPLP